VKDAHDALHAALQFATLTPTDRHTLIRSAAPAEWWHAYFPDGGVGEAEIRMVWRIARKMGLTEYEGSLLKGLTVFGHAVLKIYET
jgi:hypothetical protein